MSNDGEEYDEDYYSYEGTNCCDLCGRSVKPFANRGPSPYGNRGARSLVMGLTLSFCNNGDLVCRKCLNRNKPHLYLVQGRGDRFFCTRQYYRNEYEDDPKMKVIRSPQDHANALRDRKNAPSKRKKQAATKSAANQDEGGKDETKRQRMDDKVENDE